MSDTEKVVPVIHDVPATWSYDRVHVLSESCWCGPYRSFLDIEDTLHHRRPEEMT